MAIHKALIATGFAVTLATGVFVGQALAAQPHMRNALDALQTAREELQMAMHNKGGHRARALEYVNSAIDEVRAGMDYAD